MYNKTDRISIDPKTYYMSLKKENVSCPVCNTKRTKKLFKGDRYGMGINTSYCKKCGLIFINPRPTQVEMGKFYEQEYRKFYESIEHPTIEYINSGPYYSRAAFVIKTLSNFLLKGDSLKLLDIGCAEGTLLKRFGETMPALKRFGLEPNPRFAKFASDFSGADVSAMDFESYYKKAQSENLKFDVITLTHVMEHFLRPIETLEKIRALLTDDGLIYI